MPARRHGDRDPALGGLDHCVLASVGILEGESLARCGLPLHVDRGSRRSQRVGSRPGDSGVGAQTDLVAVCRQHIGDAERAGPVAGIRDAAHPEQDAGPVLGVGERGCGEVALTGGQQPPPVRCEAAVRICPGRRGDIVGRVVVPDRDDQDVTPVAIRADELGTFPAGAGPRVLRPGVAGGQHAVVVPGLQVPSR